MESVWMIPKSGSGGASEGYRGAGCRYRCRAGRDSDGILSEADGDSDGSSGGGQNRQRSDEVIGRE